MDQRKCECGHGNPVGTLLCESCGRPLEQELTAQTGEAAQNGRVAFPDMRYEGMARRSQTNTKSHDQFLTI